MTKSPTCQVPGKQWPALYVFYKYSISNCSVCFRCCFTRLIDQHSRYTVRIRITIVPCINSRVFVEYCNAVMLLLRTPVLWSLSLLFPSILMVQTIRHIRCLEPAFVIHLYSSLAYNELYIETYSVFVNVDHGNQTRTFHVQKQHVNQ